MSFSPPTFWLPDTPERKIRRLQRDLEVLKRRWPVGPWIYFGTLGVDGVDDKLNANPHPFAPGDDPGPPPFANGITNAFFMDLNGNVGDGFRIRWVLHGIQVDCGGGLANTANNTAIGTAPFAPDTVKGDFAAFVDGSGGFFWTFGPDGVITYLSGLAATP